MPPSPKAEALQSLESVTDLALTLLKQFHTAITEIHKNPTTAGIPDTADTTTPIDALALARDSASLIRAHGTKLSLLIINEPFTPSAIITVLRDIISGPLPALASAVQACLPIRYTALVRKELAWRCQSVLTELGALIKRIPKDGKALNGERKDGSNTDKGSMASTGLLWSTCDKTVALSNMGIGGFFVQQVDQWRETLKDILEELKDWGDEEPEDEEEDDDDDEEDDASSDNDTDDPSGAGGHHAATQAALDSLMGSQRTISAADPEKIRPRLENSLKRLRLVLLLYQAITKRRLKKLPVLPPTDPTSNVPQRLDEAAKVLQKIPDRFGDLASAFYELNANDIDETMDQCFFDAFAASELLSIAWDGVRDEFSEWTIKFQTEVKKS